MDSTNKGLIVLICVAGALSFGVACLGIWAWADTYGRPTEAKHAKRAFVRNFAFYVVVAAIWVCMFVLGWITLPTETDGDGLAFEELWRTVMHPAVLILAMIVAFPLIYFGNIVANVFVGMHATKSEE